MRAVILLVLLLELVADGSGEAATRRACRHACVQITRLCAGRPRPRCQRLAQRLYACAHRFEDFSCARSLVTTTTLPETTTTTSSTTTTTETTTTTTVSPAAYWLGSWVFTGTPSVDLDPAYPVCFDTAKPIKAIVNITVEAGDRFRVSIWGDVNFGNACEEGGLFEDGSFGCFNSLPEIFIGIRGIPAIDDKHDATFGVSFHRYTQDPDLPPDHIECVAGWTGTMSQ